MPPVPTRDELARRTRAEHARRLQLAQLALHEDKLRDVQVKEAEKEANRARHAARRQAETYPDENNEDLATTETLWQQEAREAARLRAEKAENEKKIRKTQEAVAVLAPPRRKTEAELLEEALEASRAEAAMAGVVDREAQDRDLEEELQLAMAVSISNQKGSSSHDGVTPRVVPNWICPSCTYSNAPTASGCAMCEVAIPSDVVEQLARASEAAVAAIEPVQAGSAAHFGTDSGGSTSGGGSAGGGGSTGGDGRSGDSGSSSGGGSSADGGRCNVVSLSGGSGRRGKGKAVDAGFYAGPVQTDDLVLDDDDDFVVPIGTDLQQVVSLSHGATQDRSAAAGGSCGGDRAGGVIYCPACGMVMESEHKLNLHLDEGCSSSSSLSEWQQAERALLFAQQQQQAEADATLARVFAAEESARQAAEDAAAEAAAEAAAAERVVEAEEAAAAERAVAEAEAEEEAVFEANALIAAQEAAKAEVQAPASLVEATARWQYALPDEPNAAARPPQQLPDYNNHTTLLMVLQQAVAPPITPSCSLLAPDRGPPPPYEDVTMVAYQILLQLPFRVKYEVEVLVGLDRIAASASRAESFLAPLLDCVKDDGEAATVDALRVMATAPACSAPSMFSAARTQCACFANAQAAGRSGGYSGRTSARSAEVLRLAFCCPSGRTIARPSEQQASNRVLRMLGGLHGTTEHLLRVRQCHSKLRVLFCASCFHILSPTLPADCGGRYRS